MKGIKLEVGDILLLPAEKGPVFQFLAKLFGETFTRFVATLLGHRYIHAELYIGSGWILAAWMNGVKLVKARPQYVDRFDIFRHPDIQSKHRRWIEKIFERYYNLPYDYVSLVENAMIEVASVGFEPLEAYFEGKVPYDNPKAMICSELIARIYDDIGLTIERKAEYVTPDDLAEVFVRVV